MAKMTEEEKQNWNELLRYIEKEILDYSDEQHLQKNAVLRIRGLLNGKVMANNNTENNGEYPSVVLLYTFKIDRQKILHAIRGKNFENEEMKVAYIAAIVRGDINDVYERVKSAKRTEQSISKVDTSIIRHRKSNYERKTIDKKQYEELW